MDNKELKKVAIAAPRGHSKSTCLSVNFPLQEIVRNSNIRILLVSNALEQATMFLREIKARVERDQKYREYAGDLIPRYPEKWTEREIIINRENLDIKDATISTVGTGGSILARRSDLIICDDILNPENTRTLEQREKTKRWFYEVLMPVLDPHGRLILMGTVWNGEDLLSRCLEDPSFDFKRKYKAIISDSNNIKLWDNWVEELYKDKKKAEEFFNKNKEKMYEGVKVLWGERFPYEKLYLLRKENVIGFEKSYQNNILSEEGQEIKNEWIKYYDKIEEKYVISAGTGVDLAISEKATADYTAMVSGKIAIIGDKPKIYVMPNPINERITAKITVDRAKNVSLALGDMKSLTTLWVEQVAYQKAAVEAMQGEGLPAEGISVSTDKRARLRTISIYIQNGTVEFPRRGCEALIAQLLGFGSEAHDDLVDAFILMVQGIIRVALNQPKLTIV